MNHTIDGMPDHRYVFILYAKLLKLSQRGNHYQIFLETKFSNSGE